MTLDYFDITLDDAIAQLGGGAQNTLNLCYFTVQDASSDFCQAVHRNPATGSITVPYSLDVLQANIGGLETSGYDLQARYGFDVGWGGEGGSHFDISTAWTFTDEFTVTPMQAVPQNTNECVGSYGATCGEPIPEFKGVTRFTWTTGPFGREPAASLHRQCDDRSIRAAAAARRSRLPAKETLTNPTLDAQNYLDLSFTFDIGDKGEDLRHGEQRVRLGSADHRGPGRLRQYVSRDLRLRGHDRVPGSQLQDVLNQAPAWQDRRRRKAAFVFPGAAWRSRK